MTESHIRKKQPEIVRQRLLDATAGIAASQGLNAVTIQSVSKAAGVTKGGLFHHFANKDDLIHEVIRQQLAQVDVVVDEALMRDSGRGCFTRAYVLAIFALGSTTAPVSLALFTEPGLNAAWAAWLLARLDRHGETDSGIDLTAVRMAADGVWLTDLWPADYSIGDRDALRQHLLDLTRKDPV